MILDGNRRWAQIRGLDSAQGYESGSRRTLDLLTWAQAIQGLEIVTLWPLSTANLRRDSSELEPLIGVIATTAEQIAATGSWRIRILGCPEQLPSAVYRRIQQAVDASARNAPRTVNLAIAYGGRDEITRAVARMVSDRSWAADGRRARAADLAAYLDTAGQPDPDLIIRTSGEQRLSGFMPWQSADAELYFCDALWPDFTEEHFREAMRSFADRNRRFGL
ncbi:polyprenyl diphosphate synthase [Kitasatospora sp. NPDC004531]